MTGRLDELRQRTGPLHRQAERTGIIASLLKGEASRAAYALYLRNLLPAYRALEAGLEAHRASHEVAPFALQEIYRTSAIESDLAALAGSRWRDLALTPASSVYADRVEAAANGAGTLLVAHAYVRYLGDLSGGQILRKILARTLGLLDGELAFMSFPLIADQQAVKARLLAAAETAVDEDDWSGVLAEAELAFKMNIDVSTAVMCAANRPSLT